MYKYTPAYTRIYTILTCNTLPLTRIPECIHTCIHTYMHTCMHACIHTYIHTYIHTSVHTFARAHTHTHTHTHSAPTNPGSAAEAGGRGGGGGGGGAGGLELGTLPPIAALRAGGVPFQGFFFPIFSKTFFFPIQYIHVHGYIRRVCIWVCKEVMYVDMEGGYVYGYVRRGKVFLFHFVYGYVRTLYVLVDM